jgi:cytochrome c peroxidase
MFKHAPSLSLLAFAAVSSVAVAADWQALPETAPAPANNPTTAEKVELGKILFFDPRLSSTGTVSCNSCHNVMLGGEDNRPFSMGVHGQLGGRSAPTVWNSAFNSVQFWDGRADSLEAQAAGPVTAGVEMGMKSWDDVVARLETIPGYVTAFKSAFGEQAVISKENATKAIAAYERTLVTPNSPYDQYVKGDKAAMTAQQIRGMSTFAQTGCTSCHSGAAFNGPTMPAGSGFYVNFPTFTDSAYVAQYDLLKDKGRGEVTKQSRDDHKYKIPVLRNIALTAPYFHNGSVKTLDEAVRVMANVQLNKTLNDDEVNDIVAFLNALTGEFPQQTLPRLPATAGRTLTP